MGRPLAHDHAGPPEGHWAESGGLGGFVRKTAAEVDQDPPSLGPRLAHGFDNPIVNIIRFFGTHFEQPIAAGLADHQRALQHALAQGAGGGGILGGLGGLFACLHHRGFSQVLSILRTLQIFDFGRDF